MEFPKKDFVQPLILLDLGAWTFIFGFTNNSNNIHYNMDIRISLYDMIRYHTKSKTKWRAEGLIYVKDFQAIDEGMTATRQTYMGTIIQNYRAKKIL